MTVYISGATIGDTMRLFVRLSDDKTDTTIDSMFTASSSAFVYSASGLASSTDYAINVGVVVDGITSWIGTQYFTTKSGTRPYNWTWYSTIVSGGVIGLTALEWNDFCNRINAFRTYAQLQAITFTTAYAGRTPISAAIVGEAWRAISEIPGHGPLPSYAYTGNPISASYFDGLKNSLNDIP